MAVELRAGNRQARQLLFDRARAVSQLWPTLRASLAFQSAAVAAWRAAAFMHAAARKLGVSRFSRQLCPDGCDPSAIAAVYYAFIASDQYVAEAKFTVNGGEPPSADAIGSFTGIPAIAIVQYTSPKSS